MRAFSYERAEDVQAAMDNGSGAFINRDLANYLVPVHADIPELDVVFRKEFDDKANVLGARGLGELGICGSGAAVANAVFNATGVRVRELPITLEKVLEEMVSRPASPVVTSTRNEGPSPSPRNHGD
jgi:xanthine dehydrogenase YagR molybdenum-binding subunit